jgi:hypothetical protein
MRTGRNWLGPRLRFASACGNPLSEKSVRKRPRLSSKRWWSSSRESWTSIEPNRHGFLRSWTPSSWSSSISCGTSSVRGSNRCVKGEGRGEDPGVSADQAESRERGEVFSVDAEQPDVYPRGEGI